MIPIYLPPVLEYCWICLFDMKKAWLLNDTVYSYASITKEHDNALFFMVFAMFISIFAIIGNI